MTPETRHFLGAREFGLVKPGVFLVNTGRGPTVDNRALYEALVSGRVAGAALDDPEEEPAKKAHLEPRRPTRSSGWTTSSSPRTRPTTRSSRSSWRARPLPRRSAASCSGERPQNPVNDVRLASGAMSLDPA